MDFCMSTIVLDYACNSLVIEQEINVRMLGELMLVWHFQFSIHYLVILLLLVSFA